MLSQIQLKCDRCGSILTASEDVVKLGYVVALVRPGYVLRCLRCAAEYAEGAVLPLNIVTGSAMFQGDSPALERGSRGTGPGTPSNGDWVKPQERSNSQ